MSKSKSDSLSTSEFFSLSKTLDRTSLSNFEIVMLMARLGSRLTTPDEGSTSLEFRLLVTNVKLSVQSLRLLTKYYHELL